MNILLQSVQIIDSNSPWHLQEVNVLIENGIIKNISASPIEAKKIYDAKGLCLSTGWLDMRATICDPGLEHREDLQSATAAAAQGGFTTIAALPNSQPAVQTKDVIAYQQMRTAANIVEVLPIANVTIDASGTELTEMIDLTRAGAVAFCDGENPVWHAGVIVKALQYLQPLNGLLIQNAEDTSLTKYGQMNEGRTSTLLGLKGIPKVAEEMTVQRDIELLKYAGGKIHFSRITSARSVEIIRAARKKGFNVTCDVTALHLAFDDSALNSFDTNLKLNPPLRNKEDIDALIKGLLDGTIDAIVSDHTPWDEEAKKLEFDQAAFGAISLETAFAVINTYAGKKIELTTIIEKITSAPRQILNLPVLKIEAGEAANLTLFDPNKEWVYEEKDIKSKSKNSPFIGKKLKGKAIAIFNKGLAQFN